MMREEFYHSQYGDPDHHVSARCHMDYEEGVEYIEAEGDEVKTPEINAAHESFLWLNDWFGNWFFLPRTLWLFLA